MTKLIGRIVSVHAGSNGDLSKQERDSVVVELDGIVGDRHRSLSREAWAGDKQPEGTTRRNERQWSAVSVEELAEVTADMDLAQPLSAGKLGANLCIEGIRELSRLPKGTTLEFPSGAVLVVEEYNPPCHDMGKRLAAEFQTQSGADLSTTAFSQAAKLKRGIVGVVDVPGTIRAGDPVEVEIYQTPTWLVRSAD
ncbi:MAG: MOSC domain-containing protein [Woeseiaceae bacterium]|nr:MOSC domain-containing protein [Woeseiaceae bacterium]